jgi:general nucleoside transport system permease protein
MAKRDATKMMRPWSVRLARKDDAVGWRAVLVRGGSIVLALVFSMLMILIMGYNPFDAMSAMLKGSLGSLYGIKNSIVVAIPILVMSVGLTIAFSMKYWNIGAEGQLVFGAICATFMTRLLPADLNGFVMIMIMTVAAMTGGAFWALIPGFFRAYSRTNETLFTLMMNYLAIKLAVFLRFELWKDPNALGFPQIASIPDQAHLPKLFGIHIGWLVALAIVALATVFLKYTKLGYEIRVVGESDRTAHYAGINVRRVILTGVLISGALVGLAGLLKLNGVSYTLSENIGGGTGFTAIIVAWLSQLQVPVMVLVAFLFGAMEQGSMAMELSLGIPASTTKIIEGLILFAALTAEFFIRYKVIVSRRKPGDAEACAIREEGTGS